MPKKKKKKKKPQIRYNLLPVPAGVRYVVGVDTGSRVCGVSVFDPVRRDLLGWKTLKVPTGRPYATRITQIAEGVVQAVSAMTHRAHPETVAVSLELPGSQGKMASRGLVTMGLVCGAVWGRLAASGYIVEPTEVGIWSRGQANGVCMSKEKRAERVLGLFPGGYSGEEDDGLDGADAIGIAAFRLGLL